MSHEQVDDRGNGRYANLGHINVSSLQEQEHVSSGILDGAQTETGQRGDCLLPVSHAVVIVVVYYVTIVAIGHGLLKKFWPLLLGCVLRTAGSYIIE